MGQGLYAPAPTRPLPAARRAARRADRCRRAPRCRRQRRRAPRCRRPCRRVRAPPPAMPPVPRHRSFRPAPARPSYRDAGPAGDARRAGDAGRARDAGGTRDARRARDTGGAGNAGRPGGARRSRRAGEPELPALPVSSGTSSAQADEQGDRERGADTKQSGSHGVVLPGRGGRERRWGDTSTHSGNGSSREILQWRRRRCGRARTGRKRPAGNSADRPAPAARRRARHPRASAASMARTRASSRSAPCGWAARYWASSVAGADRVVFAPQRDERVEHLAPLSRDRRRARRGLAGFFAARPCAGASDPALARGLARRGGGGGQRRRPRGTGLGFSARAGSGAMAGVARAGRRRASDDPATGDHGARRPRHQATVATTASFSISVRKRRAAGPASRARAGSNATPALDARPRALRRRRRLAAAAPRRAERRGSSPSHVAQPVHRFRLLVRALLLDQLPELLSGEVQARPDRAERNVLNARDLLARIALDLEQDERRAQLLAHPRHQRLKTPPVLGLLVPGRRPGGRQLHAREVDVAGGAA